MKLGVWFAAVATLAAQQQPKPALETAWELVGKGQRSQAVSLLREIVHQDSRNAGARLLLGSILMEDCDRAGSLANLTEAVRLRPRSGEAHNALGEAYNAFGEPRPARAEFERATALEPGHAQAHVNLAALLLQEGDAKAATPHLDAAIRLLGRKPDAAYPRYLRAKIALDRRDPASARPDLEQAVALRPDFAEAWSDLGEALKALSDDDGALAAFRKAVALSPDDAVAQTRLGLKLLDAGDAHQAAAHLGTAVRLDPKNQSALNALQLALRRDGRAAEADQVKQRLTLLLQERDQADQNLVTAIELNNRGAELEKGGDLAAAAGKYRAALDLFPEHNGIRTNLAVALLKLGQWDEGLAQMREALRRDPSNAQLKAALEDALAQYSAQGKLPQRR
jgi:protein O-GlcNAc transferase